MLKKNLGFIGVGNMGSAIVEGLVASGEAGPHEIMVFDIDKVRCKEITDTTGVKCGALKTLCEFSDALVLAVKPQSMADMLEQLKPFFAPELVVISIAAGISTSFLEKALGEDTRVVRVMPNTPAMLRCGATAAAKGKNATDEDLNLALEIFSLLGIAIAVEEDMMDTVTALSGSGPAYFFLLTQAMVESAVAQGMAKKDALALAIQTARGAGRMLSETGITPTQLRRNVTSPDGTTEAGIAKLQDGNFEGLIKAALDSAARRSREMGR